MLLRRANDKSRHAMRTANIFFETAKSSKLEESRALKVRQ